MRRARRWFAAVAWLLASTVSAETLYVTDQVTVGLRADVTPGAAVLAAAATGAKLEVLERSGSFVRVRDGNGVEGWVDATALAPQPPAAEQLKAVRAELDRTRAQLANTRGLLEKSQATSVPNTDKLQAELTGARAQLGKLQLELKKKDEEIASAAAARDTAAGEVASLRETLAREQAARQAAAAKPPVAPPPPPEDGGFSFIWLGIAFAMLLLGFVGGIVWVKESIRRRMGGLHLRI